VVLEKADRKLMKAFEDEAKAIRFEYRTLEPTMKYSFTPAELPKKMISGKDTTRMIELIMAVPHGVYRMSPDIKELVETSTNLSKIRTEGEFYAQLASRSSSKTQLEALRDHIEAIATMAGADAVRNEAYPGWLPNLDSRTLAVLKECAVEVWGKEAHIKAIHAGLETGIIGEKYPGMDMASIGPQIENPHSPDERVKVDTVEGFYKMVTLALKKLC
jgi:dipeptidase D